MAKILVVESSARRADSYSRMLVKEFIDELKGRNPRHEFVYRDLVKDPIPVLDDSIVDIIRTPFDALTDEQRQATALSETLIDELKQADFVVIGCPMYNWNVPAALKAWLDQVMRLGLTFTYGESGVVGLMGDKPALAVLARGGSYDAPDRAAIDMQKPYLCNVLRVMGFDVTTAVMEGSLMGDDIRDANLQRVRKVIKDVADRIL